MQITVDAGDIRIKCPYEHEQYGGCLGPMGWPCWSYNDRTVDLDYAIKFLLDAVKELQEDKE